MPNFAGSLPRPVILAHRGASAHAPENTLAAFRLALEHGADGVELDVQQSADGQVVVIHNLRVDSTTNGCGPVSALTLDELKRLDAGRHFGPAFAGERIPALAEVFETLGGRALINIELKNYTTPFDALAERTAALVRRYDAQDYVIFSAFNPLSLLRIRQLLPGVAVGLLALRGWAGYLSRGWLGRQFAPRYLHPCFSDLTTDRIAIEHRRGRRLIAYTVDDPLEMKRLFTGQIDGIITNDPRLARRVLEEK